MAGAAWIWGAKSSDTTAGAMVCVSVCVCVCVCVCVSESRRCDFKKSTKAKLRGFEGGSGLTGSLKQLM